MSFEVKRLPTLASFRSSLSSKPNMGAGRTIVVSGKISRTTFSPRPLVAKNSDDDDGSALKDETWIKRSTSYFATASAILSAPSTCTSSSEKFLFAFCLSMNHSGRRL